MYIQVPTLNDVHSKLALPSKKWVDQTTDPSIAIKLGKLGEHTTSSESEMVVVLSFVVKRDKSWSLSVHGSDVTISQCPVIDCFTHLVASLSINELLQHLDKLSVCPAHPDIRFIEMAKEKKSLASAILDENSDVGLNGKVYSSTVRTVSCHMLVFTGKCSACVSYRPTLRKMFSRWQERKSISPTRHTSSHSRTNFRYLTTPEKNVRMSSMRTRLNSSVRQIENLKKNQFICNGKRNNS